MPPARKINDVGDLQNLSARGVGFVIDPFNRRWHLASCPRVGAMTLGEPKWFADDATALHHYLDARMATYPTAKAIEECPSCAPGRSGSAAARRASAPRATEPSASAETTDGVEESAHRLVFPSALRITYGPKQGTASHQVRSQLQDRLVALQLRDDELLHAVFAGVIPVNSDVENQLLYNVFDSRAHHLLRRGVRFELDTATRIDGARYSYESAPLDHPFHHWRRGAQAVEWSAQPIADGPADALLSRTWWTLRHTDFSPLEAIPPHATYCATLELSVPTGQWGWIAQPERIKKLIDGAVSAFQRHDATPEACSRIAARLGLEPEEVSAALRDDGRAVLGRAQLPVGLTKHSVQWNPDDTRLVAVQLHIREHTRSDFALTGSFAEAVAAS